MKDYTEFLAEFLNGTFSTLDGNAIRTRAFQSLWLEGNKLYFSTGRSTAF